MTENIHSKLQHHSDVNCFTASGPSNNVTVSLWAAHFPFVAYVMWSLQDCMSGQSINVAAEQTGSMTDLRFTQRSH